nr:MAG TPA: hypothetical protein [Caudoviricetes sp.]
MYSYTNVMKLIAVACYFIHEDSQLKKIEKQRRTK